MRTVLFHTLGCRLNQAETALMTDRLEKAGYRLLAEDSGERPDAVIVNSCSVTAIAAAKSRHAARRFHRLYPDAKVILTGCSAEIEFAKLRETEDFVILGNPEKREIAEKLSALFAGTPLPPEHRANAEEPVTPFAENAEGRFPFRTRAMVKIQEGCNNFCTYCIVPYSRGRERSRKFAEVFAECRSAVASGIPEIVLTGVNTCAYADGPYRLPDLVDALCTEIPGDWRLRLSSTEPHPDNLELVAAMARHPDKVCRFLHLSLQHGSDRILRQMNRHYTTEEFAEFAAAARKKLPGLHLGTDVIVGFPGETEADFTESLEFLERIGFANVHIFTYSRREGTPAAAMPGQVPPEIAHERYLALEAVAARQKAAFAASQQGAMLPVIFETADARGMLHGWSDNYLAVTAPAGSAPLHRIVHWQYR